MLIFAGSGFGGSGSTLMRAVSLLDETAGAGGGAGADTGTAAAGPIGRGKAVFATGGGGGGAMDGGGGGTMRGELASGFGGKVGGTGKGFCAIGGLGIGRLRGFGTNGTAVGDGSATGGREGRLIRTVS